MNPSSLLPTLHGLGADYSLQLTRALLHFLWLGGAIAIVYAVAAHGLRRAHSGIRYVTGVTALLLMAACLPVTLFVLSSPHFATVETGGQLDTTWMPPATVGDSAGNVMFPEISILQPATDHVGCPLVWVSPYASGSYLCGAVLMLMRLALGLWGGRRLVQSCTPLNHGPIFEMLRDHARRMELGVMPAVAYCRRISVPVVVGVLRPMILLPVSLASSLTLEQFEMVLLHELAHIRRYDPAVNLLQRLIESLLFFHPAVWWLSHRINLERENACDDQVLGWNHGRVQYADALLHVAELCVAIHNSPALPNASMAVTGENASQFKRRVLRLLEINESPRFRFTTLGMATSILVSVSLLLMALAGQNVVQAEQESRTATAERPSEPMPQGTSRVSDTASLQASSAAALPAGDGSRIIARIGPDVILESDVAGAVNEVIERKKDRIAPGQLESQRKILTQKRLKCLIETKLILQDARRTIPTESWSHVEVQLTKHFEELELEKMMKKAGANTPSELDQKLRAMGTSLEQEKRAFSERVLAQQWLHQQIKSDEVAASKPLHEGRNNIPKETVQERSQRQLREYMAKLKARTPVWTIFDGDAPKPQVTTPLQR